MMIDHLALRQETTAVPHLMGNAAGEHETLRDQYLLIKASKRSAACVPLFKHRASSHLGSENR